MGESIAIDYDKLSNMIVEKLAVKHDLIAENKEISEQPNKDIKKKSKKKKIDPPTVEEVREYVKEKGYNIDADYFWSYYNASNWTDKNNEPVLNWKLKLVTWAKKEEEKPKKRQYTTAAEYKAPTKIDAAALESIRRDFNLEK